MTKNIGPMKPDSSPFAEITFNGNSLAHHMDTPYFLKEDEAEMCKQHCNEIIIPEIISQFIMEGCHFPKPGEEKIIRTALVCPGSSILANCRLRIVQADVNGNILTEGKVKP